MSNQDASEFDEGSLETLAFALEVEDGWPPVAVESIPVADIGVGYLIRSPPLFVRDLSLGDVVTAERDPVNQQVFSWSHVRKSQNTNIWLLRISSDCELNSALKEFRDLGCSTVSLDGIGVFAVSVPERVSMGAVDDVIAGLDSASVAVAFPAMRHSDSE